MSRAQQTIKVWMNVGETEFTEPCHGLEPQSLNELSRPLALSARKAGYTRRATSLWNASSSKDTPSYPSTRHNNDLSEVCLPFILCPARSPER
jgi:hypothetical protein